MVRVLLFSAFDHSCAPMKLKMEIYLHQPVRSKEAEDSAWIRNLLGHLCVKKNNNWVFVYVKYQCFKRQDEVLKSTRGPNTPQGYKS